MLRRIKVFVRKLLLRNSTQFIYKKMYILKIKVLSILSDEKYVLFNMKINTGITMDLKNPTMYCEKINWLKLNYRNPLQTEYTDKYKMRSHLIDKGYEKLLPPLIGVYSDYDNIDFSKMPNKVFLKTNHTSGINQAINNNAKEVNKARNKFKKALKLNYYKISREWNYKNIEPKILVEEFLDMKKYSDYKFFVMNGKVEFFAVIKDINDEKGMQSLQSRFNLYDTNKRRLDIDVERVQFDDSDFNFNTSIDYMIKISEDLAEPFPFCRVDFLVSPENIIFGEMTFHPNGGQLILKPLVNEVKYGDKIKLNDIPKQFLKK